MLFKKLVALGRAITDAKNKNNTSDIQSLEQEYQATSAQYERYLDGRDAGLAYHNGQQYWSMPSSDHNWLTGFDRVVNDNTLQGSLRA
jgi:hypothetical protein